MPGEHRFYEKNGLEYARVSTILGETMPLFHPDRHKGLSWWQDHEPDAVGILARGQRRGTLVHAEIEMFLLGDRFVHQGDTASVDELIFHNIPGYVNYLMPLLEEVKAQNGPASLWPGLAECGLMIEQPLYCRHGFAGTPDMRCWFEGKYTVWDWKTARSHLEEGVKKKLKPISRYSEGKVQTSSYALAHNLELVPSGDFPPVEQVAICVCYDWCEPFLHLMPIEGIREAADEFIERFGVYKELENSVFPRPMVESAHSELTDDLREF
jgi:hypothetical protein